MLILTGAEKFKTEEDRNKVLEGLPDLSDPATIANAPSGMTLDEYAQKIESTAMAALEAPIDAEAGKTFDELSGKPAAPADTQNPPSDPAPPATPQSTPKTPPASTEPPQVSPFDREVIEKRLGNMQSEYEKKLQEKSDELEKLRKETEEKLNSLKTAPEVKPDIDPEIETQLKAKISRSKEISTQLNGMDDLLEDDAQKLQKEALLLNSEIGDLNYAKTTAIQKSYADKIKAAQDIASNAVQTIEEQRAAEKKAAEEREAKTAASKELKEYHDIMDTFKNNNPSFKDSRPYSEMERDYVDFSAKLASIYLGDKLPEETTPEEREVAFAKYQKGVPALVEKVQESGIKPPQDLNTYATLSEVGALYGGNVFDSDTGQWKPRVNARGEKIGYENVNEAYQAYLIRTGKTDNDIIQQRRDAVNQFVQATDKRSNPVELDNSYQQGAVDDMTEEQAQKIMNDDSFDTGRMVMIARAGASAPEADKVILSQYNKALKTMGIPELNEES